MLNKIKYTQKLIKWDIERLIYNITIKLNIVLNKLVELTSYMSNIWLPVLLRSIYNKKSVKIL